MPKAAHPRHRSSLGFTCQGARAERMFQFHCIFHGARMQCSELDTLNYLLIIIIHSFMSVILI